MKRYTAIAIACALVGLLLAIATVRRESEPVQRQTVACIHGTAQTATVGDDFYLHCKVRVARTPENGDMSL